MNKRYEAVESRLAELTEVVDSCIAIHGAHLPAVTAAAIRAGVLRYAEGLLCLMTVSATSTSARTIFRLTCPARSRSGRNQHEPS